MRIAILDFGTNTFNLLIAEGREHGFEIIHTGKQGVKMGRGGIQNRLITGEAMERGFMAIEKHLKTIHEYAAEEIRTFATAAVRSADNGHEFVEKVRNRYGLNVQVIDGNREAELIYKGVRMAVPFSSGNTMILDIGGGSNEFIICSRDEVFWKHSFDLGMARILEQFDLDDPVSSDNISELESYFNASLKELFNQVSLYNPRVLVGASGSFDTFRSLLVSKKQLPENPDPGIQIPMNAYQLIHNTLIGSTLEERKKMPGMEPVRVEMIVPATIFVNFVIQKCGIQEIYQSAYALKEGVMAEYLETN